MSTATLTRRTVFVHTPQGERRHGEVVGKTFRREVDWHKDRMRIFDAWTIHPEVIARLEAGGVRKLAYNCGGDMYTITLAQAKRHGFTKAFAGGITHYIPLKHWQKTEKPQAWICPRCESKNSGWADECILCDLHRQ